MENIWFFCLQTLTASQVALVLLLLKKLLEDKQSPRWQYSIWLLLALRCLIPANIRRNVVLPLGLWLETAKAEVEKALSSAYSAALTPVSGAHVLPGISAAPVSITDWLFVLYALGVLALALYYLLSYLVLRLRLRQGLAVSAQTAESMERVCGQYQLKPCRMVAVPGLESAFVCGIFRPVLAVPADTEIDDKVLLHELLHLKYRDIPQNIFWAALRCLHWCNPLMHYVFNRIGNDMESLCDQRVLERLEGEERREYGKILLSMASRRYARSPGTGSISNGKRNISRRITAITRFKRYPQGMALVSVCIGLVLVSPLLIGTAAAVDADQYWPDQAHQTKTMAAARVQRCSTVAGAIDTYAKGLLTENWFYLAVARPVSSQEAMLEQLSQPWESHFGSGLEYPADYPEYEIFDLIKNTDGSYSAWITLPVTDFEGSGESDWPTDVHGTPVISGTLAIPLRIFREDGFWVVEESGDRIRAHVRYGQIQYEDALPWQWSQTIRCETGTITVTHRGVYEINNETATSGIFGWTSFDMTMKPDAQFGSSHLDNTIVYTCTLPETEQPFRNAGLRIWTLDTMEDLERIDTDSPIPWLEDGYSSVSSSSTDGSAYAVERTDGDWDQEVRSGGGGGFRSAVMDLEDLDLPPEGYLVQIILDDTVVEEIVIEVTKP